MAYSELETREFRKGYHFMMLSASECCINLIFQTTVKLKFSGNHPYPFNMVILPGKKLRYNHKQLIATKQVQTFRFSSFLAFLWFDR